jgi:diguanylate cyclase (GGDEF)-like protein/PAS domain S-box-containing protein
VFLFAKDISNGFAFFVLVFLVIVFTLTVGFFIKNQVKSLISIAEDNRFKNETAIINVQIELERKIAERTEEITKTNKLLEEQIREREVVEKIYQAGEERYYLAAQATHDVIYEHNLVPRKVSQDENGQPIINSKDYKNSPDMIWLEERIHPDDRERVISALDEVFAQGTKYWSEEYRFSQYDDQYAYIIDRGYVIYNENYQPTRMIGAMSDFTERKKAEDALKESEERYRDLIENANDIIYTTDLEGNFTSLNKAGQKLLGYTLEETLKKSIFSIVPPEHENTVRKMIRLQFRESTQRDFEIELLNSDDERLTLEVSNRIIYQDSTPVAIQGIARNISERKWAEAQLRHNALHDSLTGLPNRTLLLNQLRQAIARKRRNPNFHFAVLFLDIDRFKIINDSLGHLIGDKLLCFIAEKLKKCVRDVDTVSRLGGDEFVLLLEDIGNISDAVHVAERILESVSKPFLIEENDIYTSTSIGITFSEKGYNLPEELLRDADTAMYRAKSSGKDCYRIFDHEMYVNASKLLKTETDLRRALERDEFELHYQPIISLSDGKISEVEALLRWHHPEKGMISPMEFVPIAEDTGLIVPIGNWVIKEACRQLKIWQENDSVDQNLIMSVNLSPKQIARTDLHEFIELTLQQTQVSPSNFNLEITESAIMENGEIAENLLNLLKDLGVWLTTDDFGTGYSSLSYLHRFPIDRLKIDRSFVNDMTSHSKNSEIIRTILTLARSLRMEVVAEGIETKEQLSLLKALDCDFGQGYIFSKPVTAIEAEKLFGQRFFVDEFDHQSLFTESINTELSI